MLSYKEIEVPDASEFRNVSVVEVLVKEGDQIEVDTPLITVKNDRGFMDLPSPLEGKVQEVIVQVEDRISKGTSILLLETEVEDPSTPGHVGDIDGGAESGIIGFNTAGEETSALHEPAPQTPNLADTDAELNEHVTISVPDIGGFEQVEIIEVHIAPGYRVSIDDPLITLESDKATMDVPSPMEGTIQQVFVQVGDRVSEGSAIAGLGLPGDAVSGRIEPTIGAAIEPETETTPALFSAIEDITAEEPAMEPPRLVQEFEPVEVEEPTIEPPELVQVYEPPASSETARDEDDADAITISVPDIGDFDQVEIIEVHIAAGSHVDMEDPLITLESDKATMDVPSPLSGTIKRMLVQIGDRVSSGSAIAELGLPGEAPADTEQVETVKIETPQQTEDPADTAPAPADEPDAVREPVQELEPAPGPEPVQALEQTVQAAPFGEPPPPVIPAAESTTEPAAAHTAHASPGVRRFARELGVDLAQVTGSGPKHRILKPDVQQWVKQALSKPAPAVTVAPAATGTGIPEIPEIDFSEFGDIETQPLSRIKKLTAINLTRAWLNVPHVTQHDEADITELEAFRQDLKKEQENKSGARITTLSFLMKACVVALKEFPNFNASLEKGGENLILKRYYHIGIAVDTPAGLVVPVVRDVDKKTIRDLAGELDDISNRSREKKLSPKDLQGASFTISSLGGIGGTAFTPIVNAPEVAILGVSRSSMKPVYQSGEFVPRLLLPLSLSYDHRVIDGAQAARFTAFLASVLADVRRLLL